jgi:hypothetical protein
MSALRPTLEEELLSVYRQLTGNMNRVRLLEADVLRLDNLGVSQRNENRALRKEKRELEESKLRLREQHMRDLRRLQAELYNLREQVNALVLLPGGPEVLDQVQTRQASTP